MASVACPVWMLYGLVSALSCRRTRVCSTYPTKLVLPLRCYGGGVAVSQGSLGIRHPASAKHDRLVPVEEHARLGVPADGAREHRALDVAAGGGEGGRVVGVVDAHDVL